MSQATATTARATTKPSTVKTRNQAACSKNKAKKDLAVNAKQSKKPVKKSQESDDGLFDDHF